MSNLPPLLLPPNIQKEELLLSTQVYDIVDLLSEGPIYGFVDASGKKVEATGVDVAKGIYFNDTPLMDSDSGGLNFQNFSRSIRLGSGIQTPLVHPQKTSREKLYNVDLIGPWDWDNIETLDTRTYGGYTVNYGAWSSLKNQSGVLDESVIPNSDAIDVRHEIENNWIDRVRINFAIDALSYTQHTSVKSSDVGRKKAHYVTLAVEYGVRNISGAVGQVATNTQTIRGLVEGSTYGYSLEIDLPERQEGETVFLKIRKVTHETSSPLVARRVRLDSVVEIISKIPFTYPLSVIVGWTIDARTFRSPPQRSYNIRGKLIRIPSNYYPLQDDTDANLALLGRPYKGNTMDWRRYGRGETYATHVNGVESPVVSTSYPPAHIYRGNWDGTFKWGWTDNPAWILYDILINDVYGLGNFIDPSLIDKWTLYQIARYCDAVDDAGYFVGVPTLEGGREPRYSCNIIIENEQEAFDLINYMAGVFRGIAYWQHGGIYFADDRPKDPVMYFGNVDVKDGMFNYQDSIKNGRFTVAEVAYNDRDDNYLPKIEYVEDADGILSLGIIKNSVQSFGTTSRSEARRLGLYQIYSSQQEPEIVNFVGGQKCSFLRPGDVIGISDEVKQLNRYNGVVNDKYISSNRLYLNLDAPLPTGVETGSNIIVTLPWGFNTLESLNASGSSGIPRYAIEGSRSKQYLSLPIENISIDRKTIDLSATGIDVYNSPEPSSGDYIVNTGINIVKVPLTEAYKYIPPFSPYFTQSVETSHQLFRVISISENNSTEYSVSAVEYDSGKFFKMENEQLGYDSTNELFGDFNPILRQPNPVKSINMVKQNPAGALFEINVSWTTPTTPPSLALGVGMGDPDPYKILLVDPNGAQTSATTTGLNYVFSGRSVTGLYNVKVWSVGAAPNYLASNPSNFSAYMSPNSYTISGVVVTGMNISDEYSGSWSGGTGTYYSKDSNVECNWAIALPDGSLASYGQSVSSNSFGVTQNVYIKDYTGGIISGLSRSGYDSTSMYLSKSGLQSGFGYYPRDFYLEVVVNGSLAPNTGTHTGTIHILNPEITIDSVIIQSEEGLNEWSGFGNYFLSSDQATGEILLDVYFSNSGYGDINKLHVYTGSSAGFAIDSGSFYKTYNIGSVPLSSQILSMSVGLTDDNETVYASPYYIAIVPEDSIATGASYSGAGMYATLLLDSATDDWYQDINNSINSIIGSGQMFYGQKIHNSVLGSVYYGASGSGSMGVGLPLEEWSGLSSQLQSVFNENDCVSGSGIFPRELFHVGSGKARHDGPVGFVSIAKASLSGTYPVAQHSGYVVYVNNAAGGAELAFCDGAAWRRVSDRTVIT